MGSLFHHLQPFDLLKLLGKLAYAAYWHQSQFLNPNPFYTLC